MDHHLLMELITIPLFTGVIGYITNWTGVLMLFVPIEFKGFHLPGLKFLFPYWPRRVQVLPVFKDGHRFGWQGMVPSRAEKMASIAVDKSLVKVGNISDFYRELDPDSIAQHFAQTFLPQIRAVVDSIMIKENPRLWYNLPNFAKEVVYKKVEDDLPANATKIADQIGEHLEELIDAKYMAIRILTENPKLLNDIFRTMGAKELRFMQNFGFYFGLPCGFVLVGVLQLLPHWWVLPIGGIIIGWVVNYIGLTMIFEPLERNKWVPWKQGLLLKRRDEIAVGFGETFSKHVITLDNISQELLTGPRSDRSLLLLENTMRDTVDEAVGRARFAVKTAVGSKEYERMKAAVMPAALEFMPQILNDPEFADQQAKKISTFVQTQMSKLSNRDFGELLRAAVKQDEWLLFVHGGVLGAFAGFLHLAIFPM
ncbi:MULTISPECIES: hypothetical protein [Antrihabitans]|uniref:DUF445 domain-containing protein n=2 Tax=Antrihabitans TaxID=2799491 RepID=A0A934U4F4_9NOCA|nr:hypothetical protein [Antrihabitans stalagmiti]MBJ8340499.1 hypothetical protein [Antrihabitans stalagmiti]